MDRKTFDRLFDLRGRTAVVTGATRGIGRAIAEGLALAGASITVASRKPDACERTSKQLRELGVDAIDVPTHMGDPASVDALVAATVDHFGKIDIVVNNAANGMTQPIAELTHEAWEKSYAVNLRGPVFLAKAAYPYLRESSCPAVLNVISVGAITWSPGMAMYAGAKASLLAFTRNMAAEWAPDGIRVNALAPGTVDTDMLRSGGPGTVERVANISQMKRTAHVDEMIGPALLLVSDAGSYITGQLVTADGGYAVAR